MIEHVQKAEQLTKAELAAVDRIKARLESAGQASEADLRILAKTKTQTEIGSLIGVSQQTVSRWFSTLNIETPAMQAGQGQSLPNVSKGAGPPAGTRTPTIGSAAHSLSIQLVSSVLSS